MTIVSELDRFRDHLLACPPLQDTLAAITDETAFCAAADAIAAEGGITLDRAALLAAIRPDPLGLDRFGPIEVTAAEWPGPNWLPVDVLSGASEWIVIWAHFGGARLSEPFFEESRRRALWRPFNRLLRYRTALASLAETMPADVRLPDGLIYHLSRCGSTLTAQMIAALPGARVVSEAPPIDAVAQLVHTRPDLPEPVRIALLRAIILAYGRGVAGAFVLKLDSWHTLALPLFRASFPDVPWIFLFRDPAEILVSQVRMPGLQTVPGAMPPGLYGIAKDERVPGVDYCARVLSRVCDAVLADGAADALVIDYATLPAGVEALILPHFGIMPEMIDLSGLRAASARDAKRPEVVFVDDSAGKRDAAGPAIRAAVERHLVTKYVALKQLGARH
jgi:hypothetical protein